MEVRLGAVVLAILISQGGCAANQYAEHFVPSPEAAKLGPETHANSLKTISLKYSSGDLYADARQLKEQGFICVGKAEFIGPESVHVDHDATEYAKRIHAAVVLMDTHFLTSEEKSFNFFTKDPDRVVATVQTTGTVNTYNSNGVYGTGSYSGTSTVTEPGQYREHQLKWTKSHFAYFASYWVQLDVVRSPFGVLLRKAIGLDQSKVPGAVVVSVQKGTPAYRADLHVDDIIIDVGGQAIQGPGAFQNIAADLTGKSFNMTVLRRSTKVTVWATMNP